jgi:hypothetical protein
MNWAAAKKLQVLIRRAAWTNWLLRKNNVWWVYGVDGSFRVVQAGDVTAQDLLAGDWTNLAADGTTHAAVLAANAADVPVVAPTNFLMNWANAKKLGMQIRRAAWGNWLFHKNNLWWIYGVDGSFRVVQAGDVTAQDLLAGDWTNLAADGSVPAGLSFPVQVRVDVNAQGTPALAPTNVPDKYVVEKWVGFDTNDPAASGVRFYLASRQIVKLPNVTWGVWVGGGCQFNYYGPYATQWYWRENFVMWRKSALPYVVGAATELATLTVGPVSQCAGMSPTGGGVALAAVMAPVGPNGTSVFIG